jgi:phosphoglucomutase
VEDYQSGVRREGGAESAITLPRTDAMKFILEDGSWAAARPSGTEPKCKFYLCARGNSEEDAARQFNGMLAHFNKY